MNNKKVLLESKSRRGYTPQTFEGEIKFINDEYVRLQNVKVTNLFSGFEFMLDELDVELKILENNSMKLLNL